MTHRVAHITRTTWLRATALGWCAGIPMIAAFALAAEGVGLGGKQGFVGLGMGAAVGLLQSRTLRGVLAHPWHWTVITAIAFSVPFVAVDVSQALDHPLPYRVVVAVAFGGLAVGAAQALRLKAAGAHPAVWTIVSTIGWTLAALPTAAADAMIRHQAVHGILGVLLYVAILLVGGALLGAVTGTALERMDLQPVR